MDRLSSETQHIVSPVNQQVIEDGHQLSDWFIFRDERHFGPLSSKQVSRYLLKKWISIDHFIWRPGFSQWTKIKEIECFRACGSEVIKNMNDNDFSRAARVGTIDRIQFEQNQSDLSFTNQVQTGVETIIDEVVQSPIIEKIKGKIPAPYMAKIDRMVSSVGMSRREWLYRRASMILFIMTLVIGVTLLVTSGPEKSFVDELPSDVKQKLYSVSQLPETTQKASFTLIEKDSSLRDPVLMAATNLPVGSQVRIQISGDPTTLLGAHRFQKVIELSLSSKIFQTQPIREVTGQFIPAGFYDVKVTCTSCAKGDQDLYEHRYLFGVENHESYKAELRSFHEQTRQNARLELNEIADVVDSLRTQYKTSIDSFVKDSTNDDRKSWGLFSSNWLERQNKLIELFEQMKSREFRKQIYYLPLYERLNRVTGQLFELHMLQDRVISKEANAEKIAEMTSELSQQINLSLLFVKSQHDLMNANYNKSKGLPSKVGLKLKD